MRRRRYTVLADGHAPDFRNLFGDFRGRQHPAMPRLGALADFDAREFIRIEGAVAVAATEISGTDLQIRSPAFLAMIGTDTTLSGVMGEAALLGAGVQRAPRWN